MLDYSSIGPLDKNRHTEKRQYTNQSPLAGGPHQMRGEMALICLALICTDILCYVLLCCTLLCFALLPLCSNSIRAHRRSVRRAAVFVEIGSSEEQWGRADAAEVWANVLTRCGRGGEVYSPYQAGGGGRRPHETMGAKKASSPCATMPFVSVLFSIFFPVWCAPAAFLRCSFCSCCGCCCCC